MADEGAPFSFAGDEAGGKTSTAFLSLLFFNHQNFISPKEWFLQVKSLMFSLGGLSIVVFIHGFSWLHLYIYAVVCGFIQGRA